MQRKWPPPSRRQTDGIAMTLLPSGSAMTALQLQDPALGRRHGGRVQQALPMTRFDGEVVQAARCRGRPSLGLWLWLQTSVPAGSRTAGRDCGGGSRG